MITAVTKFLKTSKHNVELNYSRLKRAHLMPRRNATKVFGIGCPKTGTKTLGECFRTFGFRHQSCDMRLAVEVVNHDLRNAFRIADRHDSFEDWPWFRIYRELDDRYPGSKFILTVRKDTATYLSSLQNHQRRQGVATEEFQRPPWWEPIFADWGNDYSRRARDYEQHNQTVREWFQDRPGDLLVVCWEMGDGWQELCRFLGKAIPDQPFPHRNRAKVTGARPELVVPQ